MEWISTSERLPEKIENKEYLVVIKYPFRPEQMVVEWWFDGDETWEWLPNIRGDISFEITHWMELPELPM